MHLIRVRTPPYLSKTQYRRLFRPSVLNNRFEHNVLEIFLTITETEKLTHPVRLASEEKKDR